MAVAAARQAPPPADRAGARDRRRTATCWCRSTRTRCASGCAQLRDGRRRGRRRSACCTRTSTRRTSGGSRRSCSRSSRRRTCPSRTRCCRSTASSSASRPSRLNAYVGPKVSRYVARFDEALRDAGFAHERAADAVLGRHGDGRGGDAAAGQPAHVRPGRRPDRRHLGRHGWPASTTSSRSTSAAPRPTSASPPAASCACATCSTRRSATTRRWCRWSTSTRSAPAAARSPTSTRAASSASARSRPAPIPGPACYGRGGDGADLDRRAARARPAAPGPRAARRRRCGSTSSSREQAMAARSPSELGMSRRGGGARRAPDPEVRDDAGDRAQLGAPRLRPARVHARRRRRRRAAVRLRHRARARDRRACSCRRTRASSPRPGCSRPTSQHEFVATERHALKTLDRARLRRRFDELVGAGRRAARRRRRPGRPPPRAAARRLPLRGPGLRGALRRPARATVDDAWVEELKDALPRARTSASTATASTPRSRSSTSASSASAASTSCSRPSSRPATAIRQRARDASSARSSSTSSGKAERRVDAVLRPRAAARRRPDRGPGDHRAVRLDDGRSRPASSPRSTATATSSSTAPRAAHEAERGAELATPILMRVIGGAFAAIAKEMAGVLYRMSLLVDHPRVRGPRRRHLRRATGNELAESDSTPMFMGAMPKIVKGVISAPRRRHPRRRRDPAQRPVRSAPRTRRTSRSSIPIFHEGELVGFAGASAHAARHRRRLPRPRRSTSSTTGPRATSTGRSSSPEKGVRQDAALEAHPREHPHADATTTATSRR